VHNEGGNEHRVFEVVKRAITQTGGVLISSDSCTKQLFKDPFPSHDLDNQDASQFTKMEGEEADAQIDVTEPKLESLVSGVTILDYQKGSKESLTSIRHISTQLCHERPSF
jgi:hypothetical protein